MVVISCAKYPQLARDVMRVIREQRFRVVPFRRVLRDVQVSTVMERYSLLLFVDSFSSISPRDVDVEWKERGTAMAHEYLSGRQETTSSSPEEGKGGCWLLSKDDMCRLSMCVLGGQAGCTPITSWDQLPSIFQMMAFTYTSMQLIRSGLEAVGLKFTATQDAWSLDLNLSSFPEPIPLEDHVLLSTGRAFMQGARARLTATLLCVSQLLRLMKQLHLSSSMRYGLWLQLQYLLQATPRNKRHFLYPADDAETKRYLQTIQEKDPKQLVGVEKELVIHASTISLWQNQQRSELHIVAPLVEELASELVILLSRLKAGLPLEPQTFGATATHVKTDLGAVQSVLAHLDRIYDGDHHLFYHTEIVALQPLQSDRTFGLTQILCRNFGVAYTNFLLQLRRRNAVGPEDVDYRGPLRGCYLHCNVSDWEYTVSDLIGADALSRLVYASIYDSSRHTDVLFVVAGELDWRLLCITSQLHMVTKAQLEATTGLYLLPLFVEVVHCVLVETKASNIGVLLMAVQGWWEKDLPRRWNQQRTEEAARLAQQTLSLVLRISQHYAQNLSEGVMLLDKLLGHVLSHGRYIGFMDTPAGLVSLRKVCAHSDFLLDFLREECIPGYKTYEVAAGRRCRLLPEMATRELVAYLCLDPEVTMEELQLMARIIPRVKHGIRALQKTATPRACPSDIRMNSFPEVPLLHVVRKISMIPEAHTVMGRLDKQRCSSTTMSTVSGTPTATATSHATRLLLQVLGAWEEETRGQAYAWPAEATELWDMPVVLERPKSSTEPMDPLVWSGGPARYTALSGAITIQRALVVEPVVSPWLQHIIKHSQLEEGHFNTPAEAPPPSVKKRLAASVEQVTPPVDVSVGSKRSAEASVLHPLPVFQLAPPPHAITTPKPPTNIKKPKVTNNKSRNWQLGSMDHYVF
jgi:hypothetical protein